MNRRHAPLSLNIEVTVRVGNAPLHDTKIAGNRPRRRTECTEPSSIAERSTLNGRLAKGGRTTGEVLVSADSKKGYTEEVARLREPAQSFSGGASLDSMRPRSAKINYGLRPV